MTQKTATTKTKTRPRVYDDPDIDDQMLLRPSVLGWHLFDDGSLLIRIRGEHLVSVAPSLARRLLDGLKAATDEEHAGGARPLEEAG